MDKISTDKIFRRTEFSSDKIFRRTKFSTPTPKIRQFCPWKFCPIRYPLTLYHTLVTLTTEMRHCLFREADLLRRSIPIYQNLHQVSKKCTLEFFPDLNISFIHIPCIITRRIDWLIYLKIMSFFCDAIHVILFNYNVEIVV